MSNFPKLALGTWLMGGDANPSLDNDDASDISVIQTAIDSEITLIDTAQNYADGKCEQLVGQAVQKYPRQKVQLLTKQKRSNLSYQGVINGCRQSLENLGVDYIDYFVCHAPSEEHDLRDFFRATNFLHSEGLIKHVGVSNFGLNSLKIALETSDIPISLNQVSFAIYDSDILHMDIYDFCLKNNIPIQAYRIFANLKDNPGITSRLKYIAPRYSLTIHQLILAYLNSYKNMHFTIRASTSERWDEIKHALTITLDEDDINTMKTIHLSNTGGTRELLEI